MVKNDFGLIGTPYDSSSCVIVPVPYEGTVTYGKGASSGPAAIIEASQNAETFDFATGKNYESLAFHTLKPLEVKGMGPAKAMAAVEDTSASLLKEGRVPFLLGGEHSVTVPAVRAVFTHHGGNIGVVQLDAHADLRNEYQGSVHNHACVMARVREFAPALQLGIRSCSAEENELIKKEKLSVLGPKESLPGETLNRALDALPENVYLTIDIDCLDPSIMPSTGTPEPGGFNWAEITGIVTRVADRKTIVAADVMELAPIAGLRAPDFLAAKLVFYTLAELFKERR
ncbi:MAG: agmatinase [Nitrospinota bacterium]